ncbi:MAG TPA: S8 family serine peptidase, partial [Candidatus Dormibacteraeota bacterium]
YTAGYQWALHGNASSTNAPQAWCVATGSGILIADIDTGVDFGHPDLRGKLVAGAAFVSGNAQPAPDQTPDGTGQAAVMDDYGHGTMTTGIMVADTNNGYGMAAEAPDAKALVMKVFSNKGGSNGYSAYDSDVAAAIYWSVQHGARVVNLSLGPVIPSILPGVTGDPIPAAVQWASQSGAAVAIASGNGAFDSGVTLPGQGASYANLEPYALVVGAMGHSGNLASYSQTGNVYAPGGDGGGGDPSSDILSTYPTYTPSNPGLSGNVANAPFALYDGTSFATPYAAGTLALLMSHGMTAQQARDQVLATSRSVGGRPVLDAARALGGSCPAASGGGSGGGTSAGGGGCCPSASSSAASQAQPAAKPAAGPSPSSRPTGSPSPAAAPAADAPGAKPATVRTQAVEGAPRGLVVGLVALGAVCLLGALGWFTRERFFTDR